MLNTTLEIYQSFLDGIKKEYSGTVSQPVFLRIWNEWAQPEWLSDNVSMQEGIELTQKQIDDLQPLRRRYVFNPITTNSFTLPDGIIVDENSNPTERYYRSLNVMFKLDYGSNASQECELTGISDWLKASIYRSDSSTYFQHSPYRKPKDSRLYYEIINNVINLVTDATIGSDAYKMKLEYLIYPNEVDFTGTNSILHDFQKKEIVERCVEIYLERVRDPRWQTYLQTMGMTATNKI